MYRPKKAGRGAAPRGIGVTGPETPVWGPVVGVQTPFGPGKVNPVYLYGFTYLLSVMTTNYKKVFTFKLYFERMVPSKKGENMEKKETCVMSVRLEKETKEQLERFSSEMGTSVNKFVGMALKLGLLLIASSEGCVNLK